MTVRIAHAFQRTDRLLVQLVGRPGALAEERAQRHSQTLGDELELSHLDRPEAVILLAEALVRDQINVPGVVARQFHASGVR